MSIAKKLSLSEIESVYSGANSAIWHSHGYARRLAKIAAREEDFVATLVTDGVPMLADRWISLLSPKGVALRVSGVFCHGHPRVAFGTPERRIELADLLIVHHHLGVKRNTARAMLVQAKMSTDSTHTLPTGDPQLDLFSKWPKFEFVSGGLASGFRDIKETGKGSRYALVLEQHAFPEVITWADQCPWAASIATQKLSADRSFAKLIGDVLLAKDGRVVHLGSTTDEWSKMIKELLQVTGKRTYRRSNIGRSQTPRLSTKASLSGTMFLAQSPTFSGHTSNASRRSTTERFFGAASLPQTDGEGDEVPRSIVRNDNGGGISSLIIETRDVG